MRRSYPDAPFLSRTTADGLAPPIDGLLMPPRSRHRPSTRTTYPHAPGTLTIDREVGLAHHFLAPRDANHAAHNPPHGVQPTTRRTPHTSRAPRTTAPGARPTPAHQPAHTKRARTNRSGRATYSAQALGRLPWFAPCLRRSRRLRPRFDMSFSLGLLSRLKHFCTH